MGRRIRGLRQAQGLTLVQLAEQAGISQPFLSLTERGHARVSLATMRRIAAALGVPPGSLLAHEPENRVSAGGLDVVHKASERSATGDRTLWQLAQLPHGLFGTEMHGTDREFSEIATHDEDEFVYVLTGRLDVGLDDGSVHPLAAGDSLAIAAGTPHGWRAGEPGGYRVVIVTSGTGQH
jgi:transcriptional regulator with XRE-family HTH domain